MLEIRSFNTIATRVYGLLPCLHFIMPIQQLKPIENIKLKLRTKSQTEFRQALLAQTPMCAQGLL